jgi:hypothetical protein
MDDRIHEPVIDIEAIRWERINLVIESRVAGADGEALGPASLRPVHAERNGEAPPTHAAVGDGCLTLRINVMQGPEFAARHFAHLDGGASDRVIDELILGEAG